MVLVRRQLRVLTWRAEVNDPCEYSDLISFRMDWFDLLAVQGNLKSLLQNHSSGASIFQCSFTPRAK